MTVMLQRIAVRSMESAAAWQADVVYMPCWLMIDTWPLVEVWRGVAAWIVVSREDARSRVHLEKDGTATTIFDACFL